MEYEKDFDGWNMIKKRLDKSNRKVTFYEKEIWWCSTGVNVGSEQDGKGDIFMRPVYILKTINSRTFLGISLTSKLKEDAAHVSFYFNYDITTAKLSQIKVYDRNRLLKLVGRTTDYLHEKMKKATVAFILS
jgi:mRNA-degrading endonuclease toxin of MazEF toxin-antitoxin module